MAAKMEHGGRVSKFGEGTGKGALGCIAALVALALVAWVIWMLRVFAK